MAQLPDWMTANARRRIIRSPVNPMDKSTVVSIFPKHIIEIKHTVQPGIFEITPGSYEKPAILVVGPSSWWRELDEEQPMLEIPNGSTQVADAIVRDYCNSILGSNMGDCMPGLFWLPGNFTAEHIKKEYRGMLDKADAAQKNWYAALVRMADILWSRSNGNPISISEDMRLAANQLGMKDKAWMKDFSAVELRACPACGQLRNSTFPVCQFCHHIVDQKLYDTLGLKKAI